MVGDLNGDGVVDSADLGLLLVAWGPCPRGASCPADFDENGFVDLANLIVLITNWSW